MDEVETLSDRIGVMSDGKLLATGTATGCRNKGEPNGPTFVRE